MNTDHIDVGEDFSDTQLAEIFLHHRVLIVPIVDKGHVTGIVTREDFTRALAQRLLALSSPHTRSARSPSRARELTARDPARPGTRLDGERRVGDRPAVRPRLVARDSPDRGDPAQGDPRRRTAAARRRRRADLGELAMV